MGRPEAPDGTTEARAEWNSSDSVGSDLVDQSGRVLGPRAKGTRQKILTATKEQLESKSLREIRVIDVARRVEASPATFYQYFKDIEEAVLALAEDASSEMPVVAELLEQPWRSGPRTRAQTRDRLHRTLGSPPCRASCAQPRFR